MKKIALILNFMFPLLTMAQNIKKDVINAQNLSCEEINKSIVVNQALILRNAPSTEKLKQDLILVLKQLDRTTVNSSNKGQHEMKRQSILNSIKGLDEQYDGLHKYEKAMRDLCSLRETMTADRIVSASTEVSVAISNKAMYLNGNKLSDELYNKYIALIQSNDSNNYPPTSKEYTTTYEW